MLEEIAFIKGVPLECVIEKIESTNGPTYISKTTTKPNRLYDDKHKYTGTHSRRYSLSVDFN